MLEISMSGFHTYIHRRETKSKAEQEYRGKIKILRGEILVVDDQIGSPTYTHDLATLLVKMIKKDKYGIHHATNQGYCNCYEYACEIFFKQAEIKTKVNPIKTEDYPTKAKRSKNSRLNNDSLRYFSKLPAWERALKDFLKIA